MTRPRPQARELHEQRTTNAVKSALYHDLLKPSFRRRAQGQHVTFGHCYAASEALYHLLGGKEAGYKAVCGRDSEGITHWWLVDVGGNILDPTAEQYTSRGVSPPYEAGRPVGFLTKRPSKRAQKIMDRIPVANGLSDGVC